MCTNNTSFKAGQKHSYVHMFTHVRTSEWRLNTQPNTIHTLALCLSHTHTHTHTHTHIHTHTYTHTTAHTKQTLFLCITHTLIRPVLNTRAKFSERLFILCAVL